MAPHSSQSATRSKAFLRLPAYYLTPAFLILLMSTALGCAIPAIEGRFNISFFTPHLSRAGLIGLALILLFLSYRARISWAGLGLRLDRVGVKQFVIGSGIGALMMAVCVVLLMFLGVRQGDWTTLLKDAPHLAKVLIQACLTGILVGVIEELLFRGHVLALLQREVGPIHASIISSLYFSSLHFLKSPKSLDQGSEACLANMATVADAFTKVLTQDHVDSLAALFLAGVFLCQVRLSGDRRLGLCVGLHAGWVFVVKLTRGLTEFNSNHPLAFLVGSFDYVVGWLVALELATVVALMHARLGKR